MNEVGNFYIYNSKTFFFFFLVADDDSNEPKDIFF